MARYETVIGLEFHAELKTKSKLFCPCPTEFGGEPNTHVCPVCLGLPGVLPVLNKHAVELAVKAGLALNCDIQRVSKFDRKNYFYPDLPKAYQVTQFALPICRDGYVNISGKQIRINRIHLEEDAGKLIHSGESILDSGFSMPDYNRAAVPLIEIVTEPDIRSAQEARELAERLKSLLEYAGVSDVRMEQGSLRCDVNISLRPEGQTEFGIRAEIKNLNSFRAIERAIEYEEKRQAAILDEGGRVIQETRTWDDGKGITLSMRSKENAHDYRYFPEPDLVPTVIDDIWMNEIRQSLPEMPEARKHRLMTECGLSEYDTNRIVETPMLAFFFDEVIEAGADAKLTANWILGDISRLLTGNEDKLPIKASDLAVLIEQVKSGAINHSSGKLVLEEMFMHGGCPLEIIKTRGFAQISDASALQEAVLKVVEANPEPVADYKAGKKKAMGFLLGQIMKATGGQANPQMVREMLEKALDA
ncbi:MAG: Asp-tRNA(Asn)/Glu-tRNA(Gln) amidotransferase subunit GatB [Firmicutes bacterium]|nr:Asp-tRNA(Asn)/Glu-tRNA(Gln) amidotransferase subunit GatB [Bacillota bacterium]